MKRMINYPTISLFLCLYIFSSCSSDEEGTPEQVAFAIDSPALLESSQSSASFEITATANAVSYFLVQPADFPAPTVKQIINGTSGDGSSALDHGQLDLATDVPVIIDVQNLKRFEDHDIYVLLQNSISEEVASINVVNKVNLLTAAVAAKHYTFSFLASQNDQIFYEEYFNGHTPGQLEDVRSVTKGILAILVGQAISEGHFTLSSTIGDFFPAQYLEGLEPAKKNITVEQLLTMSSGLGWQEGEFGEWVQLPDEIVAILGRELQYEPGTVFNYSTPNLQMLSVIFQEATGQTLHDYAKTHLFEPLNITNSDWVPFETGYSLAGGFSFIPATGMVNIGNMVKNNGLFDGQQIVPSSYVNEMITPRFEFTSYLTTSDRVAVNWFGYLWWDFDLPGMDGYMTSGYGGQNIIVFPNEELVIVTTAAAHVDGPTASQQQVEMWNFVADFVEALE